MARNENQITRQQVFQELVKSPHGKLAEYIPQVQRAAKEVPGFLAHLIAWDAKKGEVKDSKVALPVVSLSVPEFNDGEWVENSFAHLAQLTPKELVRAYRFVNEVRIPGHMRQMDRLVRDYLLHREANWSYWVKQTVQFRQYIKTLYSMSRTKPTKKAVSRILFGEIKGVKVPVEDRYAGDSTFAAIRDLSKLPNEIVASILVHRDIPYLVLAPALGKRLKEPELAIAMIEQMSPQELLNHTKQLEKMGVLNIPAVRAARDAKLKEMATSTRVSTLKIAKAIDNIGSEEGKEKLRVVQEKLLKSKSVDGNWIVLADKSGSMAQAIEASRHIAATLAKMVSGDVYLVFFDVHPTQMKVTGMDYDKILHETRGIKAAGGTSIGCGLDWALQKGVEIDGIAIVSDGGENTGPMFSDVYKKYSKKFGKEPTVYFYQLSGELNVLSSSLDREGITNQLFDLRTNHDYYSLPNLVQTMRTNRYSLVDEIEEMPLLTLAQAFNMGKKEKKGELVHV